MTTRIIDKRSHSINVNTVDGDDVSIEATIYFGLTDTLTETQAEQLAAIIVKLLESNDRDKQLETLLKA